MYFPTLFGFFTTITYEQKINNETLYRHYLFKILKSIFKKAVRERHCSSLRREGLLCLAVGLTSMCWNMYGWLQIFLSCMIVFIRVLVPPLPWGGRREARTGS